MEPILQFMLIALIYWCVDEKKGLHLSIVVLISMWINISLKLLLNQPRPFFEGYDASLGMINASLGGLPSGHAQNTLVLFIIIASWGKRKSCVFAAALACLLTSFSGIYLGVHFPTDVFVGWILGGLILCIYFFLKDRIEVLLAKGGVRAGMIACAVISFIMILNIPGREVLVCGGMFLGAGLGYFLNRRYVGFKSSCFFDRTGSAKFFTLLARYIIGITGMFFLVAAVGKLVLWGEDFANYNLLAFSCFALPGFWISTGAPFLFRIFRLAEIQPLVPDDRK